MTGHAPDSVPAADVEEWDLNLLTKRYGSAMATTLLLVADGSVPMRYRPETSGVGPPGATAAPIGNGEGDE